MEKEEAAIELLDLCQDLVKLATDQAREIQILRKASNVHRATNSGIELQKVAATRIPTEAIASLLDGLISRGIIPAGEREKMASTLSDPSEMAAAALQLAEQLVPGRSVGIAFDPPSPLQKAASTNQTKDSEKAAEDAEWREIVRTGKC